MRLKTFLNENTLKKPIENEEKMINLLKENCSEAIKKFMGKHIIWRRDGPDIFDSYIFTPSGNRKSKNTLNYYTMILNNHPMWKDYPKREVICAGGSGYRSFTHGSKGAVYYVFPFDSAKIGICSQDDIWNSFYKLEILGFGEMDIFNSFLKRIGLTANDWPTLKEELKNTKLKEIRLPSYISSINLEKNKTMWDFIVNYMNPTDNKFKVTPISSYSLTMNDNKEVWTDSKCIFVNQDNYETEDLIKLLE